MKAGIAVTGFSPLGAGSYVSIGGATADQSALVDPVIIAIATRIGATPAQVCLAWAAKRGVATVPKSASASRMRENLAALDFVDEVSDEDMVTMALLDKNRRFNDPGVFCELAFKTFCPIYE